MLEMRHEIHNRGNNPATFCQRTGGELMARRRGGRGKKKNKEKSHIIWMEVDNPDFSASHEEGKLGNPKRITAALNSRESPALWLFQHNQIDRAQYAAAVHFRRLYEQTAGSGIKAVNWLQEPVDGGAMVDTLTDARMNAAKELKRARELLGNQAIYDLVEMVCGQCWWVKDINIYVTKRQQLHAGKQLRLALEALSDFWGYTRRPIRAERHK